jgi:hypothetical protein
VVAKESSAMGCWKLVLAGIATLSFLFPFKSEPLAAAGLSSSVMALGPVAAAATPLLQPVHFRRATSFYCYPRNLWWFYRPYAQAEQGYARCMPYFHYPAPTTMGRGPRQDRVLK